MSNEQKPLGTKAYGHIPHLPGSRMGPGDHKCHEGQYRICCQKARDRHDEVIVQEKVDGSCVAVAKLDDKLWPLTRAGYHAYSSPYEQHAMFARWVFQSALNRFWETLEEGDRIVGEWLAQAHGTRYLLPHEPFVAFDVMRGQERLPFDAFLERVEDAFQVPRLIHRGGPISIEDVAARLEPSGHGAIDPVEGAVWRVQRKGEVDFLAKWVRPGKVDGVYLPEVSGKEAVWNCRLWK